MNLQSRLASLERRMPRAGPEGPEPEPVPLPPIGWELLPQGFPSYKTVQRRLKRWLALDCFHTAWRRLAERYVRLHGVNWDQILLDGSKKPSKKGVKTPGLRRWIVVSVAPPST